MKEVKPTRFERELQKAIQEGKVEYLPWSEAKKYGEAKAAAKNALVLAALAPAPDREVIAYLRAMNARSLVD